MTKALAAAAALKLSTKLEKKKEKNSCMGPIVCV